MIKPTTTVDIIIMIKTRLAPSTHPSIITKKFWDPAVIPMHGYNFHVQ